MSKALESVSASDFTMVRDNDNQVITVKSATLDATDKTKVKLVVYTSLTDAKTYTVTYTAADEAKTKSEAKVTVTDGTVADVNITPVEITANVETLIEYQTLDANGVIISQKGVANPESKVDTSWDSLLGTMNNTNSKYILYNEGDTAKFSVTYHTYKYDTTTGAELGVISKDFTVTAVKDASVINQFVFTAATHPVFDWSKVTPKTTIALDDDGDSMRTAYFLIKDAKNNVVTKSCGYTVESSDNSVVVADGTVADGAPLRPVSKGSAFLMIKDKDGKVVHTLPITVGDKRTITTFKLSAPVVNIASSAATTDPATCGYTDIVAKDQYGENINVTIEAENKTNNGVSKINFKDNGGITTGGMIQVVGETTPDDGYDNYIIKATDGLGKSMTTSLRVNSVQVTGARTYSVVFLDGDDKVVTSVDTTLSETKETTAGKSLKAVIVAKRNNVVECSVPATIGIRSLKVVKDRTTTIVNVPTGTGVITSCAAIDATAVAGVTGAAVASADKLVVTVSKYGTGNVDKNLAPGEYTVYYELEQTAGKIEKASASFKVVDTQTAVTAKVKTTNVGAENSLQTVLTSVDPDDYIDYCYGDVVTTATLVGADYTVNTSGKNVYVKTVTVKVPVADRTTTMTVKVDVNKTFVSNSAWSTTGVTLMK